MTLFGSLVSFFITVGVAVGEIGEIKMPKQLHNHHSQPKIKNYASTNSINSELLFQSIPSILPHLRKMAKPISEKAKKSNKEFVKIEIPLIMEVEANSLEPLLRKTKNPSKPKPRVKQGSAIDDKLLDILTNGLTPQTQGSNVKNPPFSSKDIAVSGMLGNDHSGLSSGPKSQPNFGFVGLPAMFNTKPIVNKQTSLKLDGELPGALASDHSVLSPGPKSPSNLGIAGLSAMFNTEPTANTQTPVKLGGALPGALGNGHTVLSSWSNNQPKLGFAGLQTMFNTEPITNKQTSVKLAGDLQGTLGNGFTVPSFASQAQPQLGFAGLSTIFNSEPVAHRQPYAQFASKLPRQIPLNGFHVKPNQGIAQDLLSLWQGNQQISNQLLSPLSNHQQSLSFDQIFPVNSQSISRQTSFTPIGSPSFIQGTRTFSSQMPTSFASNIYGSFVPSRSNSKQKSVY